jgi:Xaa-Pro aminopeptidase
MNSHPANNSASSAIPFDSAKLDRLMDDAGIDVLIASSKHNVGYLLGGYRFFFFDGMDAIGLSRYLPLFVYVKGRPDQALYIANVMEAYERDRGRFWLPNVQTATWGTVDAMQRAVDHIAKLERPPRRIAIEMAFLPADAFRLLEARAANAGFVDAQIPLERLRARKSPEELALLKKASDDVIDSMLAVIANSGPGTTKRQMVEALKREETARGLTFEYCLITAGTSLNRAPSDDIWGKGEIASLDSGGNYKGYIGDLCRMAIHGEPDSELADILGHIEDIQQAARKPIRAGAIGGDIFAAAQPIVERSPHKPYMSFVAHGMGLISHEAPRLTGKGPVPYPGDDATRPLEAGMVLSIETTVQHPRRGYIKLEDTVAVTEAGYEAYGDRGRGWNRGKTSA